ncbi:MAG: leucine-rich repeat domain-containing protein [Acidobacteria bacterium]|nr:leucine-rich repeat domain-containing protein [Acidobacteriota bacterium]
MPSYTKADLLQRLSNGVLDLSLEQLTEIPPAVFELGAQLTSLDLRGNRITTIPDSVAKLSHLTELYLTRNQLATIPDSLAQLSQLRTLDLSGNQLTTIPDFLAQLTRISGQMS